ncbi:S41 family peptidase [Fodinibius salsisoli]|uniref:C-terminal processing protease CtpA/Prc, contains a PDZ domain n=1 Tax=Fodinibius salsisoli TaxID=2820877 RepID=A0ABT3PHU8_9BACT|nr:S41 family peptidase [Fodinibius salsisoli]MCW9705499.1 hypothetical protein [Fodinibius salsisoli]
MKKSHYLWVALLMVFFIWGCGDDSPTNTNPDPNPNQGEEASAEKKFVWNAMNYWYYWQDNVPDLDDSFDDDSAEFNQYLLDYSDAEALYEDLLYQDDRFSFFIDDYEEYQDERDGVYAALGFNYNFFYESTPAAGDLVGYVRYVIPDSPADEAGLKRLDLFTAVDGTDLNVNNYLDLLTNNNAHELTMAHIDTSNGGLSFPTDSTVTIASRQVIEDPVYHHEVIDTTGVQIGYLMYNAFQGNSHQRLNEVFGEFKSENIDELVLDLRYNGGGSVLTSQLLSSLVSGLGSNDEFARFTYNQKRSQQRDRSVYFLDEVPLQNSDGEFETDAQGGFMNSEPINNLSLNTIYVLTSAGTASASEALMNGLRAHNINVEVIGTLTSGKDVGSLLLTDSPVPYLDVSEANEEHKVAIQPIVLQFINADGETYPYEYTTQYNGNTITVNAFNPTGEYNVPEVTLENLLNKPAIGDTDEPLLARAIAIITGQPAKRRAAPTVLQEVQIKDGIQNLRPHGQTMYIEPFMVPDGSEQ